MNYYEYRQRAAAKWFLSSISLDGSSSGIFRTLRCYKDGRRLHGFLPSDNDNDEDDKSSLDISADETTLVSRKSEVSGLPKSEENGGRKSVCFGEPSSRFTSIPTAQCQPDSELTSFDHPSNGSFRYAISTLSLRRSPLVVASVVPLSRDPLMQSGITKGSNGTQGGGGSGGVRQRSVPEMPAALLNSLFRHTGAITISANGTFSSSVGQEENAIAIVRPLSHIKPVDSVDRSYAHFLLPRKLGQSQLAQQITNCQRFRRRAETVANDESPSSFDAVADEGEYQGRLHAMSVSSMTGVLSSPPLPADMRPGFVHNLHSVDSATYLSSSENIDAVQPLMYDDPLLNYNPLLLDDPMALRVTNRRVFPFQGYMTSILGYRRADEHKKTINREFHQRFPNVQLTLTKMRSIKLNLLAIALRMTLDLWVVAHAYVLFEKMILKLFVCKSNRKLCAGAALLISAKLNDLKGPTLRTFIQEIENQFRISHRDLLNMEMAVFIGLEFCVLPTPAEAMPHFIQIQKSLGIIAISQQVPHHSHSLEEDHCHTSVVLE